MGTLLIRSLSSLGKMTLYIHKKCELAGDWCLRFINVKSVKVEWIPHPKKFTHLPRKLAHINLWDPRSMIPDGKNLWGKKFNQNYGQKEKDGVWKVSKYCTSTTSKDALSTYLFNGRIFMYSAAIFTAKHLSPSHIESQEISSIHMTLIMKQMVIIIWEHSYKC